MFNFQRNLILDYTNSYNPDQISNKKDTFSNSEDFEFQLVGLFNEPKNFTKQDCVFVHEILELVIAY